MKIAVGTTSVPKIEYLKEVLVELGIVAELMTTEVESGVSNQPKTVAETRLGSINRAKNAFFVCKNADIALGMEVGYHPDKNGNYEMFCYATLIDKDGKHLTAESHRLLLPDFHQKILKDNKYLGDYVRKFIADNPDEYSQKIGEDIRNRKTFIKSAINSVFTDYFGSSDRN